MQLAKKSNMIDYVRMYMHTLHHIDVPFEIKLQPHYNFLIFDMSFFFNYLYFHALIVV
jgi:hypothetical protein